MGADPHGRAGSISHIKPGSMSEIKPGSMVLVQLAHFRQVSTPLGIKVKSPEKKRK